LRRAAIVLFIVLLPFAAHALWDFIEIRRLVREIESIRAKGEPVTEREAGQGDHQLAPEHKRAGRYYLAAAMLALDFQPYKLLSDVDEWLATSTAASPPPELAKGLEQLVTESRDALALFDTAQAAELVGFPAGTDYNYRTAGLMSLFRLHSARTLSLSFSGRGDKAVESSIAALKTRRVMREVRWSRLFRQGGPDITAVLGFSQPSAQSLRRLQAALEAEDQPDQIVENLAAQRAWAIELLWQRYYGHDPRAPRSYSLPMRSVSERLLRPWFTHQYVALLRVWAEVLEAARKPWPEKARATADAARRYSRSPMIGPPNNLLLGLQPGPPVDATTLIVDRSSRVAIAVELFRRDRAGALPQTLAELAPTYIQRIPDDPLSGRPLLYKRDDNSYTVYSVGSDKKDDGGDLTSEFDKVVEQGWGRRVIRGRDIGIRVVIRH
jgi:hypothetical protein